MLQCAVTLPGDFAAWRNRPAGNFQPCRCVPNHESAVSDDVPTNDAQLIAQTLAGRTDAFGQLVLRYQDRLFNSVVHWIGNAEDARDVVQEAFIQAFLKLESFQQRSAFSTWLYRIGFNTAVSHRRQKHPMASIDHVRETSNVEPVDASDDPAEALQRKERRQRVRDSIARLPDDHRAVLVLREIDGYDYETIAEILALPIGTVRSRLHRARIQLRESLSDAHGEPEGLGIRD